MFYVKVEKFLEGSLDWTPSPSPSVKIQIMGGKVCMRCIGKTLLGIVNKLLKTKCFTQQCFALLPQVNFPANNFNFHWRWRLIGSKQVYLPKSYLLKRYAPLELIWTIMSIWLALVGCCWLLCAFGMLKIGLWHCRDLTMSCLLAEQRIKKDSVSHSC